MSIVYYDKRLELTGGRRCKAPPRSSSAVLDVARRCEVEEE